MAHQQAVEANLRVFDQGFADLYDKRDSVKLISVASTKILIEFDTSNPTNRKSPEESAQVIQLSDDPGTLVDPKTLHKQFPHSVFKPGIKLMDFACGTGIVTEKLYPFLKGDSETTVVGVDINQILLNSFDSKATEYQSDIHIESYVCDVLEIEPELKSKFELSFDVIICTMSYHHIENYREITKRISSFLKKGGWLFIIDFYNEDVETEESDHTSTEQNDSAVRHMGGLKISSLNETLQYSGLSKVSSAREIIIPIWQPRSFVENHSTQKTIDDLNEGLLPSRDGLAGKKEYLIQTSIILAVGQMA